MRTFDMDYAWAFYRGKNLKYKQMEMAYIFNQNKDEIESSLNLQKKENPAYSLKLLPPQILNHRLFLPDMQFISYIK